MALGIGIGLGLGLEIGGGGPTLPTGSLLGVWYADQYDSAKRLVPNAIASAPVGNMFRAPKCLFASSLWWQKGSATATDDFATDPYGGSEASRLVGTGNWLIKPLVSFTLAAGTYTMAVWVKSNTGSSQNFRMSYDFGSTSQSQTATTSWTRFTYTKTFGSSTSVSPWVVYSSDGVTGCDILIYGAELYAGSTDLGPAVGDTHLFLGSTIAATEPTYASSALDYSGGGYGLIQIPAATISSSGITAIAIASKVSSNNYDSYLSKVQSQSTFTAMAAQGSYPDDFTITKFDTRNDLWPLLNTGWHGFCHRYDGANRDMFLDDVRMFRSAATVSDFSIRDFLVGIVGNTSNTSGLKVHAIALWNRALSNSEVRQAYSALQVRAATKGITVTPQARVYVAEGDSISSDDPSYKTYVYQYPPNASPNILGVRYAKQGATLGNNSGNSLLERAATVDGLLPADKTGRKFILSVLIGANDLGGYTGGAAQYLTDLAAYCDARRAAGYLVVVCTILPQSGNSTFNSRRATVNAAITSSWLGVHCDGIADFAADALMGTDTSFTDNPTLWFNTIHPSTAGHARLEAIIRPVINGI